VEGQRGEGGLRGRVAGLRYVLPGRPTVEICFVLKFFKFFLKEKFDHFWPQLQLGFTVVCLHRLKDCILSGYYTPGPESTYSTDYWRLVYKSNLLLLLHFSIFTNLKMFPNNKVVLPVIQ
jgi:hypothetical protein